MITILDAKPRDAIRETLDFLVHAEKVHYKDGDYYRRRDAFTSALASGKSIKEAFMAAVDGLPDNVQRSALHQFNRYLLLPSADYPSVTPKTSSFKEHVKTFWKYTKQAFTPSRRTAATSTEGK